MLVVCGAFFCTREISLALKHVCVDEDARQVSWNLPCSKTDPKALGKVRVWECVCGGTLEKPCAFHTSGDHLKHLRARFSGSPLWVDLSLFPSSSGDTADKAQVVKLIEAFAAIRLPIFTPEGRNIHGGHSLRVSGAQWLARMCIPLGIPRYVVRETCKRLCRGTSVINLGAVSTSPGQLFLRFKCCFRVGGVEACGRQFVVG